LVGGGGPSILNTFLIATVRYKKKSAIMTYRLQNVLILSDGEGGISRSPTPGYYNA